MLISDSEYLALVEDIKNRIKTAQYRAAIKVNFEMVSLYHDIGMEINRHKVWGNRFIDNLSRDIRMAYPDVTGYSVRNLKYMAKFAALFSAEEIVQASLAQITWYHHITLMDKVKDKDAYFWYANMASKKGMVSEYTRPSDRKRPIYQTTTGGKSQ